MIVILNLERIDSDGKLIPANNPNYAVPSYIKYAQLRYNTFSNSYVVQGTFLATGESSTIEFDLSSVSSSYTLFKLYTSTDGVTYTEDKTYGGTTGRTIFTSVAGAVLTSGNQNVAGIKDFSDSIKSNTISEHTTNTGVTIDGVLIKDSLDNSNIVTKDGVQTITGIKTYSAIPIISSLATTGTQAVNKNFVDSRIGIKQWKGIFNISYALPPSLVEEYINTTGGTVSFSRVSTGYYLMTFSAGWMGVAENRRVLFEYTRFHKTTDGDTSTSYFSILQYFEDPLADTTVEIYVYSDSGRTTLVDTINNILLTITLFQ
jgi:hypothetical protein